MRDYKLTEEMKQEVAWIMQGAAQGDIEMVTPLVYCALAPLDEVCIAEQDLGMLFAKRLEKHIQCFKEAESMGNSVQLMETILDNMLAGDVFLIPVVKTAKGLQWATLVNATEVWLPVFTSMEKAQCWLGDEELKRIPISDAIMRVAGHQLISGIVINPVEDDIFMHEEATHGLSLAFLYECTAH